MNCQEFDSLMADYIENTLTIQEKSAFENHFNECQNCFQLLHSYKNAVNTLSQVPEIPCPDSVVEKIYNRVGLSSKKKPLGTFIIELFPKRLTWKPVLAAAAVILIIVNIMVFNPFGKKTPKTAYTEEEILKAQKEVKLALGYFYASTAKTARIVEDEVIKETIAKPIHSTVKNLNKLFSNGG